MHELVDAGALPDGGRAALERARADVAGGVEPRYVGLEQAGRSGGSARQDEAVVVAGDRLAEPVDARVGAKEESTASPELLMPWADPERLGGDWSSSDRERLKARTRPFSSTPREPHRESPAGRSWFAQTGAIRSTHHRRRRDPSLPVHLGDDHRNLVGEAVAPRLARFERADQRMLRQSGVTAGMTTRRRVTTADVSALEADTQVQPHTTVAQTVLAPVDLRRQLRHRDGGEV